MPIIARKLQTLLDVGLGYITLGQSATTLSGGEAQRVKLSLELSKRDTGRTLYILDEPTTGLHFHDIDLLLKVIHKLRDQGNTVVVIEHNLDVIKTADWVIDLGPEGGDGGGRIMAQGSPKDIAANPDSVTGPYLKQVLDEMMKLFLLACFVIPVLSAQALEVDADGIVAAHNRWRKAVGAPPLTYSSKLAASAQEWANHLKQSNHCRMQHSKPDGKYGENLVLGERHCMVRWQARTAKSQPEDGSQRLEQRTSRL